MGNNAVLLSVGITAEVRLTINSRCLILQSPLGRAIKLGVEVFKDEATATGAVRVTNALRGLASRRRSAERRFCFATGRFGLARDFLRSLIRLSDFVKQVLSKPHAHCGATSRGKPLALAKFPLPLSVLSFAQKSP